MYVRHHPPLSLFMTAVGSRTQGKEGVENTEESSEIQSGKKSSLDPLDFCYQGPGNSLSFTLNLGNHWHLEKFEVSCKLRKYHTIILHHKKVVIYKNRLFLCLCSATLSL